VGGVQEGAPGALCGAHPSIDLRLRAMRQRQCHCQSPTAEESPVGGDVACCSSLHRDGWRACLALGGGVLYRGVGAHLMRPSGGMLCASWLPNSKGWRSGAHGLSGVTQGSATCSLDRHPVRPNWPFIWMRLSDSLGQSRMHGGRQTLN
jgi:hypothetical protein